MTDQEATTPDGKGQRSLGKKLQLKLPVEIKGTQAAKLDSLSI